MIIRTAEYNAKLITIFFQWYLIEMPKNILTQIYKYIVVLSKIYSFSFLLKTFFSPWKNQVYAYPDKGFDIKLILEVWTSNMVARIVGAIVRGFTMLAGLIFISLTIFLGLLILVIWIFYPVIFVMLIISSF